MSGATSTVADDVIVTGSTAVLNLNTIGVLAGTGGSNGLYARTDAVINLGANDVTGVNNSGGNDFFFLGDIGVGKLNTNGFNVTTPRLEIGDDDTLIDTASVTGSGTLTVTADFNLYRGSIAANLAGAGAIEKYGLGDVTLSGDNSGLTTAALPTLVNLGNLILDYTANNATKLSATNQLDMRGGTLTLNGNASANTSQTVAGFTLASGGFNEINVNRGGAQSATLNLGAITRGTGQGTIRFGLPVSGAITTTTGNTGTTGILGGWATVTDATGTNFAKNDGANNIVAVATTTRNDVSTWASGEHITDDTTGFTGTTGNAISINSLRFNAAGPSTVTIGNGLALGVNSGGILQTGNVTGGTSLITGGKLVSGTAAELIFTTDSASQLLTVASTITGSETITKTGNGTLRLSGNNNYTGATRLQSGTLQLSGGNAIGDTSAVPISAAQSTVFELLSNETIGVLSGGVNANLVLSEVRLNGNALTLNHTGSGVYSGAITGNASSSIIKNGASFLQLSTVANTFAGTITVNSGQLYLSVGTTLPNVPAFTLNKGAALVIDGNGGTTTNARIADTATITLNSADGNLNGDIRPSGLTMRRDQGSTQSETVGVLTLNSGASYARVDSTATGAVAAIVTDNIVRSNGATFDVRGTNLSATANQRSQLRIGTAGNQTAFIGAMVGGGSVTLGTKNISIVPWAIAEEYTGAMADANMGNSLATYVSGNGFRALNLGTEYNTYTASAVAAENIRESLAADMTGLGGKTINALVLNNSNTAANTIGITGSGAGQTLAVTSGTMLFTATGAITGTPAMGITLGGFNAGITVGSTNEYVVFVQNPTAAAAGGLVTATINSPLTSIADITKSGRGTLILTGTNTAGGNTKKTTLNEGVLQIGGLNNIGGNTGDLMFAGGTLKLGAGFVDDISTRTISFLQAGGTLDTSGLDVTFANSLGSGTGGFTKIGAGNLTLNAAATYTGSTTVSAGTMTLGAAQAIGTGTLAVSGGATLAMGANNATVAGLSVSNAANIISGTGTLTVNGDATVNRGTIAPLLAGSMNLIKQTASQTVTLSNPANTFTGYTHVQDGTLSIASIANTGVASSLGAATADNAAIRLGNVTTTGILAYTGGTASTDRMIVLPGTTGGGTIDGGGSGALTLAGNITGTEYGAKILTLQGTPTGFTNVVSGNISDGLGTVGVTKAGAGLWSLTGTNTYTGTTTLSAGTLVISNNNNLGSTVGTIAPVTFNGGTLRYAPAATNTDISGRTVTLTGAGTIDTNGQNITYANTFGNSGTGALTKTGRGTLTLSGASTYTGNTNVTGGTLIYDLGASTTTAKLLVGYGSGASGAVTQKAGVTLSIGVATAGTDVLSLGGTGGYGYYLNQGTLSTGQLALGGNSIGTNTTGVFDQDGGSTTVTAAGGYLIFGWQGTNANGVLNIYGGTVTNNSTNNDTQMGFTGSTGSFGMINLLGAGALMNTTAGAATRVVDLAKTTGNFAGVLNLNGGTLLANSVKASSTGTPTFLNFDGGTLKANSANTTFITGLTAATIYSGGATIDTNSQNVTIPQALLAPTGAGVTSISVSDGGASYIGAPAIRITGGGGTGATAIAQMDLDPLSASYGKVTSIRITSPGTGYTSAPTVTLYGGGAATAATVSAPVIGATTSGGLTKNGAGTLTLSGANTFGGPLNVNGGTLAFATSANLGDSTRSTNTIGVNGATLNYTGGTALDLGPNRVLTIGSGGATINVGTAAAALTFSGGVVVPSTANLVKSGAGGVILSGSINLNGGTTTVSGGLLRTGFGAAGTSALTVAAGATLHNVDASGTTLVLPNTGSLTFDAGATLASASTLGFGLNASTAAGITLTSGGALTINGSGTVFVDVLSLGTPLSPTTYNLLSVPGGGLLTGTGGAVTYALNDVVGGYTYTLNKTPTLVSLTVGLFSGSVFWHGDLTGPAGSWSDYRSGDTNWRNAATAGTDDGVLPGAQTTVIFSASEATGPAISTTLDGNVTIKNLQFTSNPVGVTSVIIAQGSGGALTIAPALSTDGIAVADNAGAITISAPLVAGSDQTWNVAGTGVNGSSLTVSGGLTGSGNITKTGSGTATITAASSTLDGGIIWDGGNLTLTQTGTGVNNLVFNGAISGSGAGPLLINGTGNLALNGANTYTGGTTLIGGTVILGHKQAFGAGTVNTLTTAPILQAGTDLSGANALANAFILDTNLTVSGTNNLELGGTVTLSTGNRNVTNNLTGAATLKLSGNIVLGEIAGAARTLTVNGTGSTIINGVVSNGPVAGGWLVKGGTGTLTLGAANTYTGFTIIDLGTLILAPGINQSMTNTFYFGSSAGATTAGTFDLGNASATFTATLAFWNQISSPTNTPAIIVGSGQSLNLNGNVLIGSSSAASTTTLMTASGLGTINVTNLASAASFRVGGYTGSTANQGNRANADFGGLAALNISLNTTNGILAVSNIGTANTDGKYSTMTLAATTNITAKTLAVGDFGSNNASAGQVNALKLGSIANNINVDAFNIGTGTRDLGSVTFNTSSGAVSIHGVAGPAARTAFNMGTTGGNTGVSGAQGNTFDVSGHTADLMLGAVAIGTQNRGNTLLNTFAWDKGQLDMTSLTLSTRTAAAGTGSGPYTTSSTVTLGSAASTSADTVAIQNGILQMALTSGAATTASVQTATVNIAGGVVTIGQTGGTSITMASAVTGTTANASLNLTGGTTTLAGNILKGGGAGTTSATVTLSGTATLDMGSNSIGSAAQNITFNAESGTLQNLGELNGGGALTKTTAGTLTVSGANGYTGATSVNAGTLLVSGSISGTTSVTVSNGGTLLFAGAGNHINDLAPVILGGGPTPGSGGIFNTGGVSEGPDNVTQNAPAAMGALTLSLNSTIDFTTGNGSSLLFSNLTYTPGEAVRILNWTGMAGGDNGIATNDRLLFSGTSAAFTNEQLAAIQFFGDNNLMISSGATQISFNGYTELVPVAVPEPSTWLSALAVLGLIGYRERRRLGRAFERGNA